MDGCLLIIGILFVLFLMGMMMLFVGKMGFVVPPEHVGWDGTRVYPPGTYWIMYELQLVSLAARIETYGVTSEGLYSVLPFPKTTPKFIVVWKPDPQNLHNFLQGDPATKIAEMLRTIPSTNLSKYANHLGITIISIEKFVPRDSGNDGVEIGEGLEIPY